MPANMLGIRALTVPCARVCISVRLAAPQRPSYVKTAARLFSTTKRMDEIGLKILLWRCDDQGDARSVSAECDQSALPLLPRM